ncbi:hypothetical protein C8T65DRAFT_700086 [Cerioporus squamosus]|nr:hypothetical protein C8T65DRAFT_700086 [Cerioporus squamosus]
MYIQHCITDNQFGDPDQCFEAFMRDGPRCVGVIMPYLLFVTQKVGDAKSSDRLRRCYAEAVKVAGREKDSGVLWKGYIDILNSCKANTPWEVQQKFNTIRHMAYLCLSGIGDSERAQNLLIASVEANPTSFLLNFAYAEMLEAQQHFSLAKETFEKLLSMLRKQLDHIIVNLNTSREETICYDSGTLQARPKLTELSDRRKEYGVVWIAYIRFIRRTNGLNAARETFNRARQDSGTPWEVHEAAALMEYHYGKDAQAAKAIFKQALESFRCEVPFVLRYMSFLIAVNDESDARALFEQTVPMLLPGQARPLWEYRANYEYQYGDLTAARLFEKRMAEVYSNEPPIKRFAERYRYGNIDPIATRDLGFNLNKDNTRVPDRNTIAHLPMSPQPPANMLYRLGLCTTTAPNEHVEAVQ